MTSPMELAKFLAAPPVVLLLESDMSDLESLSDRLCQLDCVVVRAAPSCVDALGDLGVQRYDVVLVDVSGLEAAHRLREQLPNTPPVVVLVKEHDTIPWNKILACGPVTLARRCDLDDRGLTTLLHTFKLKVRGALTWNSAARNAA